MQLGAPSFSRTLRKGWDTIASTLPCSTRPHSHPRGRQHPQPHGRQFQPVGAILEVALVELPVIQLLEALKSRAAQLPAPTPPA
jgi:hypothetical protein